MPYRLRIRYEDPQGFREEFERNLSMGGAFVPTPDPVQLRSLVELEVDLAWADARLPLETQVVHVVPLERALKPLEAGVIVAFVAGVEDLRETLGPYLAGGSGGGAEQTADALAAAAEAPGGPTPKGPSRPSELGPTTTFHTRVHRIDSESLSLLEASVLELATAGIAVERMLEVIPEEHGDIWDTLRILLDRGVLAPA